ncbi:MULTISPECIES: c-type cytochrome biogenesis protein CcsB [Thermocrispum]|jgi:cytochrome c-type biogenesis protein CcsB|uniref:C-type cytochrome biogenesis protein CcsB n=1 Tax=Thermocrispum agreste TaxID=37925 RepID=A0A2W4JD04_9PSEU|nr:MULTISPECIES: c-type cytochrome biogenesis protein CcsB [Thermocrispum]PZM96910.1 MAG: c-type cytochrome biogenesis protein CcsB [Thermocrispum agreste]
MTAYSQFSDLSYTTAAAIYVLAMLFVLVEQAFGRVARQRVAQRDLAKQRALVGAGAPVADGDGADATHDAAVPAAPSAGRPASGRPERFGRMGIALMVLGALLHVAALVLRGLAAGRAPWGNMYEYLMALSLVAVVTWLVLVRKYPLRHLTAFVLLPVVFLMFVGGTLYVEAGPLVPALQSYWLVIHVAAAIVASGMFLVPGVASVLYLMRTANEGNPRRFRRLAERLPGKDVLDRIAYRTSVLAFPIYTFGVFAGAIWAESAWGRFWDWDPKETVSFVAWVIYAAYLHARATAGWRGKPAAWINTAGFACIVFNFFFINLVTAGLHSYAGV